MNILITGIHGFVGSNLVKALRAEHTLYGLDLVSPATEGVVQTFGWEALNNGSLPAVDVVIHLAGKAHDTRNTTNEQAYFDINTGLTEKIFAWFRQSGATKFIFFSSVKAVADTVPGAFLTEDDTPDPLTPYGRSKLAAEQLLNAASLPEGKQLYILRPCMIHGPGNKGNLNLLYRLVSKGLPWPLGAFDNRRSFLSVGNLAWVIGRLVNEAIPGGAYQLADDEPLSTNELISLIAQSRGQQARIWHLPNGWITALARVGGRLHLPLNPERLHKLTENYVVSNARIKQALGISHLPVSAREGLAETLRGFDV
ncbi:NAD-dependent epimerase/dehydratase family protein [Gaoshiqia sediminis]|uniref:NAD-dependent epimerase/dehydratase family protein n=1 Tax=Gaoshiqia sediminis TaxID=2986998 RepID=A0AA41YAK8_9BACT|nr:NAD-dependent epimerase/dehydratase family protein [Gaoshiqia sediminis]MCW0484751.1 NAD-dependent epimerase/dehydratase family protein [Gaoshiqia sediminis]